MPSAVGQQFLADSLVRLYSGSQLDKSLDLLHLVWIRHTDYTAHLHLLMGVQNILDLAGIHIVAGGDDHALGAAPEIDEALLVHNAQIAGVYPCQAVIVLAQGLGRLLGVVHILLHDGGAGQQDLALFTIGQIENILDANDMVQMSCVIGVPDAYKMQKVKAFVMLKPGVEASDATREALLGYCRKHVAKYAMPYDIEFRDELPKTLVGKVAYRVLEEEELAKIAKEKEETSAE